MGRTGIYACEESVRHRNSLESVALFSLKQEAPASIGGSTFTIFFVNRHGQPVQIDRLLRNNDKRFKKHFFFPHNISKMARAGYFDTLEPPEPEEELPPDYLAYCDPITGAVSRNPKLEKQEDTESASSEKITPNPKFVGQSWDDFKEKMDQRYGGSGVIEVGP